MVNMKNLSFLLLSILITSCSKNPAGFTINGITSDIADSTMVYLAENEMDIDSTFIINNRFSFAGKVDGEYTNLWIHTKGYGQYKSIWVMNEQMTFDATNSSFRNATVTGSRIQNQDNEYHKVVSPFDVEMDSIETLAENAKEGDSIIYEYFKQYERLEIAQRDAEIEFVKLNPEYELSSHILSFLMLYIPEERTKELYEGLHSDVKLNEWGEIVLTHIKKSVKMELGLKAVDITLPNIDGEEVSLSDFEGKYVLLEFWSSTCGPCRMENITLRELYKNYKDDGFEIYGVSLDTKESSWQSAIDEDTIIWTTVSDLKGSFGEVPLTYNVSSIPTNYLLDKNGVIIGKYLRGDLLREQLEEIFGK
jgi:peroxiredoxin